MIDRRPVMFATRASVSASAPTWYVAGWLTVPEGRARSELLVLVHGANSDHRYWDFPVEPDSYSFVSWAQGHGLATLMIDRIGSGISTRPPGSENTVEAQADVLHQIITTVRVGTRDAPAFSRIILIGASLGSVVCGFEAARYGDVQGAILTAYLPVDAAEDHDENGLWSMFEPATRRRKDLVGLIDDDYLLPAQVIDAGWLFRLETADRSIVAAEESMAGPTTRGELAGALCAGPFLRTSRVPTMLLVGQYDPLLYEPQTDADCYDSSRRLAAASPPNFEYRVVPDTGHGLNLHHTAHGSFQIVLEWIDRLNSLSEGQSAS